MNMTKKDYIIIAKQFAHALELCALLPDNPKTNPEEVLKAVILDLAEAMQGDNPRFDRRKFLTACNVEINFNS